MRTISSGKWMMQPENLTSSMKFLHTVSVTIENGRLPKVFDAILHLGCIFSTKSLQMCQQKGPDMSSFFDKIRISWIFFCKSLPSGKLT